MADGVPVKKRWKIDFSSICNKNVVSFAKATGVKSQEPSKPSSNDNEPSKIPKKSDDNLDGSESDQSNELGSADRSGGATVQGDFSNDKYKPIESFAEDEEELDYNELDEDVIQKTKYLGIGEDEELNIGRRNFEDFYPEEDEEDEDEEEIRTEPKSGDLQTEKFVEELLEKETVKDDEMKDDGEEIQGKDEEEESCDSEEDSDDDDIEVLQEMEESFAEPANESVLEDLNESVMEEVNEPVAEKVDELVKEETGEEMFEESPVKSESENVTSSMVKLFEPLNPDESEKKPDEEKEEKDATPDKSTNPFEMHYASLDLSDPSSPPLMVSKPVPPKPQARPKAAPKKKKIMITIQNYNSGSEEEPEVKVRPQRRSKPTMRDLLDQHRIFNTTSFVKETRPETYQPAPVAVPTIQHDASAENVVKEEIPVHPRALTSSSDDTEDGLPLSQSVRCGSKGRDSIQFVPKKVSPEKDEHKLLKKVKKRKLKKKKKDPEEPQKPVSAYALFFRDMQSNIKAKRPEASFGEISKIVANEWESLERQKKSEYKKKTETAKKDYLKRLAAYKANKISSEPFPETVGKPEEVPVTTIPSSFVPSTPVVSGHLYSAQQTEQPSSGHTDMRYSHEHNQSQEDSRISSHHSINVARHSYVPQGTAPGEYQHSVLPSKPGICVNEGCTNLAIEDNRWDREYCSTECVVQHCRDAFQSWVMQRQDCLNDSTTAIY